MTSPRTPGEAITRATERLAKQRQAARALSDEIAQERQATRESQPESAQEGTE